MREVRGGAGEAHETLQSRSDVCEYEVSVVGREADEKGLVHDGRCLCNLYCVYLVCTMCIDNTAASTVAIEMRPERSQGPGARRACPYSSSFTFCRHLLCDGQMDCGSSAHGNYATSPRCMLSDRVSQLVPMGEMLASGVLKGSSLQAASALAGTF